MWGRYCRSAASGRVCGEKASAENQEDVDIGGWGSKVFLDLGRTDGLCDPESRPGRPRGKLGECGPFLFTLLDEDVVRLGFERGEVCWNDSWRLLF